MFSPAYPQCTQPFFAGRTRTRLHLEYEAVGGPHERLADSEADLLFHRGVPGDLSLERIDLGEVKCASGGARFPSVWARL